MRHRALGELSMKMENAVVQHLAIGESVEELSRLPTLERTPWWRRLGIGIGENPAGVLVRTDHQVLLVKETVRLVRGEAHHGSIPRHLAGQWALDAW